MKQRLRSILEIVLRFYVYRVPQFLVWLSLVFLAYKSYFEFKDGNFSAVIPFYLTVIGVISAFAAITFSYSGAKIRSEEEHSYIINAGELFFYAAILLIISLLVSWVIFEIKKVFGNLNIPFIPRVLDFVVALSYTFLYFAANALSKALNILESNLWNKLRTQIR